MGDCHLSPKKHRSLRNANQYVLSKKWLKICSANTKMAISNLKENVYLTKLSPTAHKHLCLCPWSLSGLWETFIDFYLISYCQNTPRLTQLLDTFDAARKIFEKCVQFNKASSNCLQEALQPQSFKNVTVNPTPWQLHSASTPQDGLFRRDRSAFKHRLIFTSESSLKCGSNIVFRKSWNKTNYFVSDS